MRFISRQARQDRKEPQTPNVKTQNVMKPLAIILCLVALSAPLFAQQQVDPAEENARLRESLRQAVLQARDLQAQIANLQADQIAKQQEVDRLTAQLKRVNEELVAERNASTNTMASLNEKISAQQGQLADQNASIEKWRVEFAKVSDRATRAERERDQLKAVGLAKDRLIADQRQKNAEMYAAGTAVLDRYQRHGLGDAILARENFVAATRARFQTLMQEYQDKLLDARIQPQTQPGS